MRKILAMIFFSFLIGCSETEWTEGVSIGGFKRGLSSQVKYNVGGKTTFSAFLESEAFQELEYPITLTIYLNNQICDTSVKTKPDSKIIAKAECSGILGKGLHTYEVKVTSANGLDYISDEEDLKYNRIEGALTYTLEYLNRHPS